MSASIITITREFGSGGRTIGRMVAQALNYDFYDWNLVSKIAAESGFAPEFVEENMEDASSSLPWLFRSQNVGGDLSDQLFAAQRTVILQLAEKGNCVIVGRCADYILRHRTDVLNCFIFADEESKKERIIREYGGSPETVAKDLKNKDKKRKAHYQYYTGRKWGRSFYYDVSLDSGRLGLDACAGTIAALAESFPCNPKNPDKD